MMLAWPRPARRSRRSAWCSAGPRPSRQRPPTARRRRAHADGATYEVMFEHSPSFLPRLPPHRPSAATKAAYQDKVAAFCAVILELQSRLDFAVGSRGWAYILEGERFIDKDEIDSAQALINACRKSGDLPLDICSEDDKRIAENVE